MKGTNVASPESKPGHERGDDPDPPAAARRLGKARYFIAISVIAAALTGLGARARASCSADCRDEYVSALKDCRAEYEQGNEDLQDLEDCIADGKDEYDDCVDDCTSTGAGGVVACSSPFAALTLAADAVPVCVESSGVSDAPSCRADPIPIDSVEWRPRTTLPGPAAPNPA